MVRTHAPALDKKLAELTSTCHAVHWGTIELSHLGVTVVGFRSSFQKLKNALSLCIPDGLQACVNYEVTSAGFAKVHNVITKGLPMCTLLDH